VTRKERVLKAIHHESTDYVPYSVSFTQQAYEKTKNYLKDENFYEKIGNHIVMLEYAPFEEIKPEYFKDVFGVVWNRTGVDKDIGVIDNLLIPEPDIYLYDFPEPDEAEIRNVIESYLKEREDAAVFFGIGFSMFERAWTLCGMENILVYMKTEPDFVHALMDRICEYNLKIIDIACQYDIDGVHFGDDWGQQCGLIMGPQCWHEFIRPRMERMYRRVKDHGLLVSQHSCGDVSELFPTLIEIGLDVYQTFQPEIYDICTVKEKYGEKLCFWGGISTQRLLPFESPGVVAATTKKIIDIMGKGGGYIAAPTHAIPGDVPPENIVAMINAMAPEKVF